MIVRTKNPRKQGDAGMGVAIGWFSANGYTVAIPLTDSQRYDLIVDDGSLKKVSVRTTTMKSESGFFQVGLRTIGSNMYRTKIVKFNPSEIDLLFVVCEDETKYLIPATDIKVTNNITLNANWDKYKV